MNEAYDKENLMGDSLLYFNLDSTSLKEETLTQPLASSARASKRLSQRHQSVWGWGKGIQNETYLIVTTLEMTRMGEKTLVL